MLKVWFIITIKDFLYKYKNLFNIMVNLVIAVIGEDEDAGEVLFKGFKKFPAQKVVLLVKEGQSSKAKEIEKDLDKFGIEYEERNVSEFLELEEVFKEIKYVSEYYKGESIVINVDCDYMSSCLALSSAFVNGILAIGVLKEEIIAYPIMKFSYYNAINEKKMELLRIISKEEKIESMEKLSKLSGLSLPLIAYHLKGNRDSQGLVEMNLVLTERKAGSLSISLTDLGRLIVGNTVDYVCSKNSKDNKNNKNNKDNWNNKNSKGKKKR